MQDGKYVIMVVDDDQDIRYSLRLVLESNGYVVADAPTAEQALKVYPQVKPDLLIVDLMMEEIDAGTSFVKSLQALGNKAPVYMLSSVGDNLSMTADYSALGLSGVFQKPIDNDALLSIVRSKLK
ncbi:MAG: response regulator [Phycisphaerae bacterium]|nr:response regulator [Phycisphaerae bacterium]